MRVNEEFIRSAQLLYLRCGKALYAAGSWDDEFMYIAGVGDKKWTVWTTDGFFDSFNDGYYLYNPVSAEEALEFVRKNNISEEVEDRSN